MNSFPAARSWAGRGRRSRSCPRQFHRALVLIVGALLSVRTRTVAAALRVTGHDATRFSAYHRVLSRARWSCRGAARILLGLITDRFVPRGPGILGLDDTIERRWGSKITARGIYRDPVRSSRGLFVKVSGLRWLSLSVLGDVPWAGRVWALPFLTVLCPSERYYAWRGRLAKKLTDHARQAILQVARWLRAIAPGRRIVVVGDSGFAAIRLLAAVQRQVTMITRLRLDAALYDPACPRTGAAGAAAEEGGAAADARGAAGRPSDGVAAGRGEPVVRRGRAGGRSGDGAAVWYHAGMPVVSLRRALVRDPTGTVEPKGFLSTDPGVCPVEFIAWYVRRWSVEVTFAKVRRHLDGRPSVRVETQRQWSDLATLRTTPCLLGLFSVVALVGGNPLQWLSRTLCDHAAQRTRLRSRSKPARPYICRLSIFSRLMDQLR